MESERQPLLAAKQESISEVVVQPEPVKVYEPMARIDYPDLIEYPPFVQMENMHELLLRVPRMLMLQKEGEQDDTSAKEEVADDSKPRGINDSMVIELDEEVEVREVPQFI